MEVLERAEMKGLIYNRKLNKIVKKESATQWDAV